MPNTETKRTLTILRDLRENTDDDHPATIAQILDHLSGQGITTTRQTVTKDIASLTAMGIDIVCDRGVQNQYFIASRTFSVPELKIMIDAVQAANFISQEQTGELVRKIASLASSDQADALRRNLYVSSAKREESAVLNSVDWLNNAINEKPEGHISILRVRCEGAEETEAWRRMVCCQPVHPGMGHRQLLRGRLFGTPQPGGNLPGGQDSQNQTA